jgi:hypothetical protein
MGNCTASSKKYNKSANKTSGTELIIKPVPTKYNLSQTIQVYEAVLNAYIYKKSLPECGTVFMSRGGKSHISLTLLPGNLTEMAETDSAAIIKLLEDYFISIRVNHEIYINLSVDDPNIYKLYCHLITFG